MWILLSVICGEILDNWGNHRTTGIIVGYWHVVSMATSDGQELRAVLSKRHTVLEAISTGGKTKPELVEILEHSRSTIDRGIEDLSEVGCVTATGRRYSVSPLGVTALQLHREYVETSAGLDAAEPLLNALERDDPVNPVMFRDAEVYVSDPQTPEVGIQRSIDVVENAHTFRGYAPVVFEEYFDIHLEQHEREEFQSEIILEAGLYEKIQTHFKEKFRSLRGQDGQRLFVTDRMLSYAPWVAIQDTASYAGMTVYDGGAMKGVVINESSAAVAWMRGLLSELSSREISAE